MASIFKRRRKVKLANEKVVVKQSQKYYTRLTDADGIKRTIPLYTDKTASMHRAAELKKEFEQAGEGLIDRYREDRKKPLKKHLEDFHASLKAKGNTDTHVKQVVSRAKKVIEGCKFRLWPDIRADRVQQYLADLRNNGKGISAQTSNFYLQSIKQFGKWMKQSQRAGESPLEHLKGLNVRIDRRHDRRALEPEEISILLEATKTAPERFGMTGHHRALLYRLAIETGLRASELRSLKVSSFDFEQNTVAVEAGYSKHRHRDEIPLKKETAILIMNLISDKTPNVNVFPVPAKPVNMLKADLAKAGIPYVDEGGLYADFHSLRHTTGSLLAASGTHPKVAQSILRHSDINLTMSRYSHIFRGQESEAIAALPDFSSPKRKQKNVATGTDGKLVDEGESNPKQLTRKLTPFSYSGCNRLAKVGNQQDDSKENPLDDKCLSDGKLSNDNHSMSSVVNNSEAIRPAGLEPATFGLGNRRQKTITLLKTKTYSQTIQALTNQLADKIQKQPKILLKNYPQTLLKSSVYGLSCLSISKQAVKALVDTHSMKE